MFKFGKGKDDDPKKALEKASNLLNKGLMGGLTKAFMGEDFAETANNSLNIASQALDSNALAQQLAQTGVDAEAEVISHSGYRRDYQWEPGCGADA